MLEWSVREDDFPLPTEPPDSTPRRKALRLLLFAFAMMGIVLVGIVLWRTRLVRAEITHDLEQFIRREEQARRFGITDPVTQWVAEDVPATWLTRYENSFIPPPIEPIPVTIALVTLEIEGEEAIVEVQLGRQVQERRYRQTTQGWRRVPLNLAAEKPIYERVDGTNFTFYETNRAFAERVLQQYPDLIEMWQGWGGNLPSITTVDIHNQELARPAYVQGDTLHIANPAIASVPAHWNLTGEEVVWYRMAREIGSRVTLNRVSAETLPGNDRFIEALVTVNALRWAVPQEIYTPLAARWRELATVESGASFYDRSATFQPIDPFAPTPEEAVVLLIADTLYTQGGEARIAEVVRMMITARNWDDVFRSTTGLTLLELETSAVGRNMPAILLNSSSISGSPVFVPYSMPHPNFQIYLLAFSQPIWVHTDLETEVYLPDGTKISSDCATVLPIFEIKGEWYESGLRFHAERIEAVAPPQLDIKNVIPAPADTFYYVATMEPDAAEIPGTQLVAVTADGTQTRLWRFARLTFDSMLPYPNQQIADSAGIMAVGTMLGQCHLQWIVRYTPDDGKIEHWLFYHNQNLAPLLYFWDEIGDRGIVAAPSLGEAPGQYQYWYLHPHETTPKSGATDYLPEGVPWMLRPGRDQILLYDKSVNRLFLYDLGGQREIWSIGIEPQHFFGTVVFDPTGRYLYVTITRQEENPNDALPESSTITRFDLQTGDNHLIWEQAMGGIAEGAIDATGQRFYVIAQRRGSGAIDLLKYEDEQWSSVFTGNATQEQYSYLRACGGGGAIFVRNQNPLTEGVIPLRYDLYRIDPNGEMRLTPLPELRQYPIGC